MTPATLPTTEPPVAAPSMPHDWTRHAAAVLVISAMIGVLYALRLTPLPTCTA